MPLHKYMAELKDQALDNHLKSPGFWDIFSSSLDVAKTSAGLFDTTVNHHIRVATGNRTPHVFDSTKKVLVAMCVSGIWCSAKPEYVEELFAFPILRNLKAGCGQEAMVKTLALIELFSTLIYEHTLLNHLKSMLLPSLFWLFGRSTSPMFRPIAIEIQKLCRQFYELPLFVAAFRTHLIKSNMMPNSYLLPAMDSNTHNIMRTHKALDSSLPCSETPHFFALHVKHKRGCRRYVDNRAFRRLYIVGMHIEELYACITFAWQQIRLNAQVYATSCGGFLLSIAASGNFVELLARMAHHKAAGVFMLLHDHAAAQPRPITGSITWYIQYQSESIRKCLFTGRQFHPLSPLKDYLALSPRTPDTIWHFKDAPPLTACNVLMWLDRVLNNRRLSGPHVFMIFAAIFSNSEDPDAMAITERALLDAIYTRYCILSALCVEKLLRNRSKGDMRVVTMLMQMKRTIGTHLSLVGVEDEALKRATVDLTLLYQREDKVGMMSDSCQIARHLSACCPCRHCAKFIAGKVAINAEAIAAMY